MKNVIWYGRCLLPSFTLGFLVWALAQSPYVAHLVGPMWNGGFLAAYMLAMISSGVVCGFLAPKGFWFLLPLASFTGQTLAAALSYGLEPEPLLVIEIQFIALFSTFNLLGVLLGISLNEVVVNIYKLEKQRHRYVQLNIRH